MIGNAKGSAAATQSTRDRVARGWRRRGFSCDLWVDPPGQVWEDYAHQTDELLMVLEGELQVEFQGHRLSPAIGDEVLIPAKVTHTVRNIGKVTARWLYGYQR
jgi:mannose-6-phosphate isomerase-like protein (cupin superfamily)